MTVVSSHTVVGARDTQVSAAFHADPDGHDLGLWSAPVGGPA